MSATNQFPFSHAANILADGYSHLQGRRLAHRLCQAMVLLPLFSLILLPEYVQGLGDPETKSVLYRATIGPWRLVDVLLLAMIAAHGLVWASSRNFRVRVPRELVLPGLGFLAAVMLAMIYGALHGGTNVFFDWRALALGIGLYAVFAMWLQTPHDSSSAVLLFAGYMALRIGLICSDFIRGGGDVIVGMRIPVFDGPTLTTIVFVAVLALAMGDTSSNRWQALVWMSLSAVAYLVVLLCFRRTFWAELGVATLVLLSLQKRGRRRKLLIATAALVAVGLALDSAFYERVQSMDFTTSGSEFSQGNPDHVGELLDAWEQVQAHPLVGIGLGTSFQTSRIQDWKEESVMVHNAPLHVWLKYGLLGLVCYVWFHFAVFRWLYRQVRNSPRRTDSVVRQSCSAGFRFPVQSDTTEAGPYQPEDRSAPRITSVLVRQAWLAAALAYLAAQFVVSLGFTPWPYSSLQSSTLIAFILAVAMRGRTYATSDYFRYNPFAQQR